MPLPSAHSPPTPTLHPCPLQVFERLTEQWISGDGGEALPGFKDYIMKQVCVCVDGGLTHRQWAGRGDVRGKGGCSIERPVAEAGCG